jgi:hypothetical protein
LDDLVPHEARRRPSMTHCKYRTAVKARTRDVIKSTSCEHFTQPAYLQGTIESLIMLPFTRALFLYLGLVGSILAAQARTFTPVIVQPARQHLNSAIGARKLSGLLNALQPRQSLCPSDYLESSGASKSCCPELSSCCGSDSTWLTLNNRVVDLKCA